MTTGLNIFDAQILSRNFLAQGSRRDGRRFEDNRPIVVNVKSLRRAEGSAVVRLGKTTVVCGIKAELAKPKPETPHEGYLVVNVDLPPLCSPACPPGPPVDEAQAATALVSRALLATQAVDLRALCIKPDQLAWVLYLDIVCLNLDGGLMAAAVLAASAALKHCTLPAVDLDVTTGVRNVSTGPRIPLPINATPFATTFALFEEGMLQDPTAEEEAAATGLITAVVCTESERALPLHMPGCRPLSPDELVSCTGIAAQRAQQLAKLLTTAQDSPER